MDTSEVLTAARLALGSRSRKRHSKAKLSDDQVRAIRTLAAEGHSKRSLSLHFKVSTTVILQILNGLTYKDVK